MHTHQTNQLFLGALEKLRKLLFASSRLSVGTPAWNNAAPTGQISMKFYNRGFF
jgi:hypothetical protein